MSATAWTTPCAWTLRATTRRPSRSSLRPRTASRASTRLITTCSSAGRSCKLVSQGASVLVDKSVTSLTRMRGLPACPFMGLKDRIRFVVLGHLQHLVHKWLNFVFIFSTLLIFRRVTFCQDCHSGITTHNLKMQFEKTNIRSFASNDLTFSKVGYNEALIVVI